MDEDFDQAGEMRAEAAEWFARLKSVPVSRDTLEQFFAWRRTPAHGAAFDAIERFWSEAGHAGEHPDLLAATADAYARGQAQKRRKPSRRWRDAGLGIGLAMLAAGLTYVWLPRGEHFATQVGERSVVTLEDGSKVTLDSSSALDVRFTKQARRVTLDHGQAYFEVAHAPERPFTVESDGTSVVATGTQFEVRRFDDATEVTLVEGSVRVNTRGADERRLTPGQQYRVTNSQPVVRAVDTGAETAWRRGQIVLDGVTLAAAVDEINRYTRHPIRLDAPRTANSRLSGSFEAGDTNSFAAAAAALLPVKAVRGSDDSIGLVDRDGAAKD